MRPHFVSLIEVATIISIKSPKRSCNPLHRVTGPRELYLVQWPAADDHRELRSNDLEAMAGSPEENVCSALDRLGLHQSGYIQERTLQVWMADQIYKRVQFSYVWLEEGSAGLKTVFKYAKRLGKSNKTLSKSATFVNWYADKCYRALDSKSSSPGT
jgi:hypothetical protein